MTNWKLKYRIKEYYFPTGENLFAAQYRILGMWIFINHLGIGRIILKKSCKCENYDVALSRIIKHSNEMKRAGEWVNKIIIYKIDPEDYIHN